MNRIYLVLCANASQGPLCVTWEWWRATCDAYRPPYAYILSFNNYLYLILEYACEWEPLWSKRRTRKNFNAVLKLLLITSSTYKLHSFTACHPVNKKINKWIPFIYSDILKLNFTSVNAKRIMISTAIVWSEALFLALSLFSWPWNHHCAPYNHILVRW